MKNLPVQKLSVKNDFVLLHYKGDIPCFQFSGFTKADKATDQDLNLLLKAVIVLADSADETTKKLSDHYPAQHAMKPTTALKRGGAVHIPLDARDPSVYISIWPDCIEVPFVWYNAGSTQVKWGRFEAAIRETIRLAQPIK